MHMNFFRFCSMVFMRISTGWSQNHWRRRLRGTGDPMLTWVPLYLEIALLWYLPFFVIEIDSVSASYSSDLDLLKLCSSLPKSARVGSAAVRDYLPMRPLSSCFFFVVGMGGGRGGNAPLCRYGLRIQKAWVRRTKLRIKSNQFVHSSFLMIFLWQQKKNS